jgi:TolB-like protein
VKEPFVDLGERRLNNIARPVRIFALTPVTGRGIQFRAQAPQEPGPLRLSIVVLPFANIGGDLEHGAFVDGVTESLTTDLSRMSGMLVIGRNTAFAYKGKAVDSQADWARVERAPSA